MFITLENLLTGDHHRIDLPIKNHFIYTIEELKQFTLDHQLMGSFSLTHSNEYFSLNGWYYPNDVAYIIGRQDQTKDATIHLNYSIPWNVKMLIVKQGKKYLCFFNILKKEEILKNLNNRTLLKQMLRSARIMFDDKDQNHDYANYITMYENVCPYVNDTKGWTLLTDFVSTETKELSTEKKQSIDSYVYQNIQNALQEVNAMLKNGYRFSTITEERWHNIYETEIKNILSDNPNLSETFLSEIFSIITTFKNDMVQHDQQKKELNTEITLNTLHSLMELDGLNSEKILNGIDNCQRI